jgi:hypothetical protein
MRRGTDTPVVTGEVAMARGMAMTVDALCPNAPISIGTITTHARHHRRSLVVTRCPPAEPGGHRVEDRLSASSRC